MKRKTVNSILKGVAGVGLTLGGVSALSDANLVFANELEQPDLGAATGETKQEEMTQEETSESEGTDAKGNVILTMNTVADAMIKAAKEANKSADVAAATDGEDQPVADTTVTNGENQSDANVAVTDEDGQSDGNVPVTNGGDQTDANVPTNEKGSEVEGGLGGDKTPEVSDEESPKTDVKSPEEKLAELKKAVDDAQDAVNKQKSKAGDGKVNTNYYRAADELVKLMVEYYAVEAGFDGTVEFNNPYVPKGKAEGNGWVSDGVDHKGNYKQNYLATTYQDKDGNTIDIIYYDYVNANADGVFITDTPDQDIAKKIHHIVVLEKTPVFIADGEAEGSFTFERDEYRNITAYIVDGNKISVSQDNIKYNEDGERIISESKDEDGSDVETSVRGNNDKGYTVSVVKKNGSTKTSVSSKTYDVLSKFYEKSDGETDDGGKGKVYKMVEKSEGGQGTSSSSENETTETTETTVTTVTTETTETPATPQPETPETEIEDEDVPLADVPDVADEDIDTDDDLEEDLDEDVTDLEDEDVPLAVLDLDEPVDIPDADVPLSDNPETGDALTATWIGTAAASVAGLFGASRKKRKG